MAAGFEGYTVGDLRKTLMSYGWTEEEAAGCIGKVNLVYEVVKLAGKNYNAVDIVAMALDGDTVNLEAPQRAVEVLDLSEVEFESDDIPDLKATAKETIEYGDPLWSQQVFSYFSEDEVINGNPTVPGLRRVAEKLLGAIVSCGPIDVKVYYPDNALEVGRATVTYEIVFAWAINAWMAEDDLKLPHRSFRAVAGSYLGNTDDLFSVYPEAIAETRAEGRVLRKALGLKNTVSHEEITDKDVLESVNATKKIFDDEAGEWGEDQDITPTQKRLIEMKCEAMDINVLKFINKANSLDPEKPKKYASIDEVPRGIAGAMVKELSKYQSEADDESTDIPKMIIGFEKEN